MAQHEVAVKPSAEVARVRRIKPGDLMLAPDEILWLQSKWDKVRRSNQKADEADKQWNKINDEINDYLDRKGISDIIDRENRKDASIALKNALQVGLWHSGNAQRHIDDVQLFLKLKEHGML